MSVLNLDIEDSLRTRLDFLLNEFESYRVSNAILIPVAAEKKESLLKKFFFSDF